MMMWMERGGPVMWPLLVLSLVAGTLIVERLLFWTRERRRPAREVVQRFFASHADALVAARELDPELPVRAEERRLERGMAVLDTVITAAPLLGILGTVLGIIDSFELLSARGSTDPLAATGGVAQALITTASGLVIALCVIFAHNYFRTRIRDRLDEVEVELRRRRSAEQLG